MSLAWLCPNCNACLVGDVGLLHHCRPADVETLRLAKEAVDHMIESHKIPVEQWAESLARDLAKFKD